MDGSDKNINPMAIPVEQAARLLSTLARRQVSAYQIEGDIQAGAPTNTDGTINLLHYAAWLLKETGRGD